VVAAVQRQSSHRAGVRHAPHQRVPLTLMAGGGLARRWPPALHVAVIVARVQESAAAGLRRASASRCRVVVWSGCERKHRVVCDERVTVG